MAFRMQPAENTGHVCGLGQLHNGIGCVLDWTIVDSSSIVDYSGPCVYLLYDFGTNDTSKTCR